MVVKDVFMQLPDKIEDSPTSTHEAHMSQATRCLDVNNDECLFLDWLWTSTSVFGSSDVFSSETRGLGASSGEDEV